MWVITQALTPDDAGVFFYSFTLMTVVVQLSRSGTEHFLVKELSDEGDQVKSSSFIVIMQTLVVVSFVLFTLLSILFLLNYLNFFTVYDSPESLIVFYIFMSIMVFFTYSQVIGSYFQSQQKIYSQYWAMNVGVTLLASIVALLSMTLDDIHTVLEFSAMYSLVNLVILLTSFLLYFRKYQGRMNDIGSLASVIFNVKKIKVLAESLLPYAFDTVCYIIIQWGGQLLSGLWLTNTDLALLSVSQRLAILIGFVFIALSNLIAPQISSIYKRGDIKKVNKFLIPYLACSNLFAFAIFFTYLFFGEHLLGFFGEFYVKAHWLLISLSFSVIYSVIVGPVGTILMMTEKVMFIKKSLIISGSILIVLSFLLIPALGLMGAIIATIISTVVMNSINMFYVWKIFSIQLISYESITLQYEFLFKTIFIRK